MESKRSDQPVAGPESVLEQADKKNRPDRRPQGDAQADRCSLGLFVHERLEEIVEDRESKGGEEILPAPGQADV